MPLIWSTSILEYLHGSDTLFSLFCIQWESQEKSGVMLIVWLIGKPPRLTVMICQILSTLLLSHMLWLYWLFSSICLVRNDFWLKAFAILIHWELLNFRFSSYVFPHVCTKEEGLEQTQRRVNKRNWFLSFDAFYSKLIIHVQKWEDFSFLQWC